MSWWFSKHSFVNHAVKMGFCTSVNDRSRFMPQYNMRNCVHHFWWMRQTVENTQTKSTRGEIWECISTNSAHYLKDIKTTVIDVLRRNPQHKVTHIHTHNLPLTSSRYHCRPAYLSAHWIMWLDMFVKAGLLSGMGEYCRRQSRLRKGTKREEDWQRGYEWACRVPCSLLLKWLHQPLTGFL